MLLKEFQFVKSNTILIDVHVRIKCIVSYISLVLEVAITSPNLKQFVVYWDDLASIETYSYLVR